MPRTFNGSTAKVQTSAGGLVGMTFGTMAALVRRTSTGQTVILSLGTSAPANLFAFTINSANQFEWENSAGAFTNLAGGPVSADGWCLVVMAKATGSVAPTFWKYVISTGAWTTGSGSAVANSSGTVNRAYIGMYGDGASDPFAGDIGAVAVWNNVALTDVQVRTLPTSLAAWWGASALWVPDQAATTQNINDLTGGGANQSALTGTTVATTSLTFGYGTSVLTSQALAAGGGSQTLAPPAIASTTALFAPTIVAGAVTIAPPAIGSTVTVFAPTVAPGAVTLAPPAIASTAVVRAPVVVPGAVTLSPPAIASTAAVQAPAVTPGAVTLAPPAIASSVVVYAPTITPGAVTLTPPVIASTTIVYPPSVVAAGSLLPPTIASTTVVYAPTVIPGAVTLAPPAIASTATVYAPTVAPGTVTLAPPTIAPTTVVRAPAVTSGAITLLPPTIGSTATVYAPTVGVLAADPYPERITVAQHSRVTVAQTSRATAAQTSRATVDQRSQVTIGQRSRYEIGSR